MEIKPTKMQKLIERHGKSVGVHYTEKTYVNIERILKSYRAWSTTPFDSAMIKRIPLEDIIPKIYEAFLSDTPIEYDISDQFVLNLLNEEKISNIVVITLNNLEKMSPVHGPTYRNIIEKLYCENSTPLNKNIYAELGLSRHVYGYRKQEATMAFGILFWQHLREFWKNKKTEAALIEERTGRKNMLSSLCNLDI